MLDGQNISIVGLEIGNVYAVAIVDTHNNNVYYIMFSNYCQDSHIVDYRNDDEWHDYVASAAGNAVSDGERDSSRSERRKRMALVHCALPVTNPAEVKTPEVE